MPRTRAGLLEGASRAVAEHGVRGTTMAGVAGAAGVAKATVYNHFRAKADLMAALVGHEAARVAELARTAAPLDGLAGALAAAVAGMAGCPALRRVAADEPGALAPLLTPTDGPAWAAVRGDLAAVLTLAGHEATAPQVEVLLRWLLGHLLAPAAPAQARAEAEALAGGVPVAGRALAAAQAWPG